MFDMFVDAIRDVAGHLPSPRHLPLNTCPCENNHRRHFPSRLLTEYRVDAGEDVRGGGGGGQLSCIPVDIDGRVSATDQRVTDCIPDRRNNHGNGVVRCHGNVTSLLVAI